MIQRITENDTTLTRAEAEYIDHLKADTEDPAKRHRIIIRVWVSDEEGFQPVYLYEPTHETLQMLLSEITPIWARTQVLPYCVCSQRYFQTLLNFETVRSSTTTLVFPMQAWVDLKDRVPRTVLARLKDVRGKTFFSTQEAADALVQLFSGVLTDEQIEAHGNVILSVLKQAGDAELARKKRLSELQAILDEFHGNAPHKPMPPTEKDCPFCHLPYRYSLPELLPYEQRALDRVVKAIVGAPVMLRDIPKVLEALEMWVFAADTELFSKKNGQQTVTGMMISRLKAGLTALRTAMLMSNSGSDGSPAPNETDTSSTSTDSPPPKPPDATLLDN